MASAIGKGFTGDYADHENGWVASMNENLALTVDGLTLDWAQDRDTTTGLTYGYRGGVCIAADGVVTTQADGTVALTDDATNYVERDRAGAVSANTSEFTPGSLPMAEVVCASGAITSVTDRRTFAAQGPTQDEVDAALALKAPLASPTFTGTPAAPTATTGTNTTQLATTAFVQQEIASSSGYTDEQAQDAVGGMLDDGGDIDFTYDDATPKVTAAIKSNAVTTTKINDGAVTDAKRALTPWATLTDGATITWDVDGLREAKAKVTLGGDRTLDIDNSADGSAGILIVTQGTGGGHALTLPAGSVIMGGGGTAPTLSTAEHDVDILAFEYDGTNYYWTVGLAFS